MRIGQPDKERPYRPISLSAHVVSLSPQNQLKYTITKIGEAIKNGANYPPIILHARKLASRAGPKDYLGQVAQIYDDFVKRWRYVRDPRFLETLHTSGKALYGQVMGFDLGPGEHGHGDCDEAASAIGAQLEAIGLPVSIVTISPRRPSRQMFNHVFVRAKIPKLGWYSVDPVGYPAHGPGWTPPHTRIAHWDLNGRLLATNVNAKDKQSLLGGDDMYPDTRFQSYGFGSLADDYQSDRDPDDWATHGLLGFGAYVNDIGLAPQTPLLMEVDEDDEFIHPDYQDVGALVRTKMLELDPYDFRQIMLTGKPRLGCVALGDDGDVYQYTEDPNTGLGFFRKLFRRVRKKIRKGARWLAGKAKKLIRKLPGGKSLIKLYGKIHKIGMKIVKPLAKLIGPIAKKLAPIAALIPGYGPVISAAMYKAGRIGDLLKKFGVSTDRKGKPKFKSSSQAKAFQRALKREAEKTKRRGRRRSRRRIPPSQRHRLIEAGSRAHRRYLRGFGVDMPDMPDNPEYN